MGVFENFIYTRSYARWLPELKRRETWEETVNRYCDFIFNETKNCQNIPHKTKGKILQYILEQEVMPSMRLMWSAGENVRRDNISAYNCTGLCINDLATFEESMYILLAGAGDGFSLERRYSVDLPDIKRQRNLAPLRFTVPDSKLGWKEAINFAIYNLWAGRDVQFDLSEIRPAGSPLKTSGGYASGPEPLRRCLEFIRETILLGQGRQLTSLEVSDILNEIAASVVCGGVRRSSEICLTDPDDNLMRDSKQGEFHPRRFMANVSAVYRSKPDVISFTQEFMNMARSGSGERGIFNLVAARKRTPKRRDAKKIVCTNPCGETLLRDMGLCNLSEVIIREKDDFDSIQDKIKCATWIGCIQATLTYFPHMRPEWQKNAEEERLLGVSLTGLCDNMELITPETLRHWKRTAIKTAKEASELLEINMPAAITVGKPSGCRPWNGLVTTDKGIFTLQDLFEDHPCESVWSPFRKDIKATSPGDFFSISQTYNNGLAATVNVNLSLGMKLQCTPNHQWFVKERVTGTNHKHTPIGKWVVAAKLQKGDILEVMPGIYSKAEHSSFLKVNSLSLQMREDVEEIKQPDAMNKDIAWLLGYLWGDGAMSPTKYRIRFTDERIVNLEKAQRILKEQFNLDTKLHKASEHRKAMTLDIGSKVLWHWLIKNNVWKYYNDSIDIIPILVRSSSSSDIIAFIAGMLDADGWMGFKNNEKSVVLTTASELLARHIQEISLAVGLVFGVSENVKGNNFQKEKSMFLMGLAQGTLPEAFKILEKSSNKAQELNSRNIDTAWTCLKNGNNTRIIGKVESVKEAGTIKTYDIETSSHWFYAGAVKSHNTVSQLVNCSSGIHSRWAEYYIRRVRISTHDALFKTMIDQGMSYEMDKGNHDTAVFSFPVKAPPGCKTRNQDTAIGQLEWYRMLVENWAEQNMSCTIYVKESEWLEVCAYVYKYFDSINGVSFFPYSNKKYNQAPYEEIDQETYTKMVSEMPEIDFSKLSDWEDTDNTEGARTLACASGACEL